MSAATGNVQRAAAVSAQRPPLVTRPLLVRFISIIGAEVSFYLPLSVVPLYVKSSGSAAGAGAATGVLLAATVAAELATPRLVHLAGYRVSLAAGLFLLGAPALVLLKPVGIAVVIAVNIARGVGFAITTVAGGALTASLIPAQRRGEGLGLVGIVGGVPAVLCLPAGVWIATRWGYAPVFAATAAAAMLALGSVRGLPRRHEHGDPARAGVLAGLRDPGLVRPAGVFFASAMAAGVLVTFLPLSATAATTAIALLTQSAAATAGRWAAGRIGDRYGQTRLLPPGLLLCAAGMAAFAAARSEALAACAAGCFGIGFGVLQNATLATMYARGAAGGYSAVSAIWNAAYDAGMSAGAIGIGLVAGYTGYRAAFGITAALIVPALVPARRDRRPPEAPQPRHREPRQGEAGTLKGAPEGADSSPFVVPRPYTGSIQ
ncbi:MAG: MFS transporter [Streptosporangiaceae bacterium]|nr:MFS transporter [Streptosporangiaceae bacterium]